VNTHLHAVLFDFDGTLAEFQPSNLALYVQAAAEHGVVVSESALVDTVDAGWERWQTPLGVDHAAHSRDEASFLAVRAQVHTGRLAAAGVLGDLDAIAARISELEYDPAHYRLYEDTLPALARVRAAGVGAVIVSNHVWRLPEITAALGLGAYVDGVVTSARVGYRKPHPGIYRAAMAAVGGGAPQSLLFVGDSRAADVEGPRAMGMRAVLLDRAGESGDAQAIRSLLEVPL
jgi:putative hydrolase of the HAD superfamily